MAAHQGETGQSGVDRSWGDVFRRFAHRASMVVGTPPAFAAAVIIIVLWAVSGPLFAFSNTWQLVINTGTTIVTFLMVFLIQNTQNRDARAMHLKLDELIRAARGARNTLIDLEDMSDEELDALQKEFERQRERREGGPEPRPRA
jgi:low affinity Fe/Cu permease